MSASSLLCSGHSGSFKIGELGWAVAGEKWGKLLFYAGDTCGCCVLLNELFTSLYLLASCMLVGECALASKT